MPPMSARRPCRASRWPSSPTSSGGAAALAWRTRSYVPVDKRRSRPARSASPCSRSIALALVEAGKLDLDTPSRVVHRDPELGKGSVLQARDAASGRSVIPPASQICAPTRNDSLSARDHFSYSGVGFLVARAADREGDRRALRSAGIAPRAFRPPCELEFHLAARFDDHTATATMRWASRCRTPASVPLRPRVCRRPRTTGGSCGAARRKTARRRCSTRCGWAGRRVAVVRRVPRVSCRRSDRSRFLGDWAGGSIRLRARRCGTGVTTTSSRSYVCRLAGKKSRRWCSSTNSVNGLSLRND